VAQGVPGRLSPWIFSTFGTTRVVGRQPNASAAFTPGEISDTHFQRLSQHQGTWFCRKEPWKKSQVTPPGIDPGTVRLVAQHLNPRMNIITEIFCTICTPANNSQTETVKCLINKNHSILTLINIKRCTYGPGYLISGIKGSETKASCHIEIKNKILTSIVLPQADTKCSK
jgi:hypothetical protein